MKELKLKVEKMVCEGCENRIVNALSSLEGVEELKASHVEGTVLVNGNDTMQENIIQERIEDLGFEVK